MFFASLLHEVVKPVFNIREALDGLDISWMVKHNVSLPDWLEGVSYFLPVLKFSNHKPEVGLCPDVSPLFFPAGFQRGRLGGSVRLTFCQAQAEVRIDTEYRLAEI